MGDSCMGTLIGDNTTKWSKRPKSMGIIHITQNATINVWNTCVKEGGGGDGGVLVRLVVGVVEAVSLFKRFPL